MKTKTSILALTKAFFILLVSVCTFSSCDMPTQYVQTPKNRQYFIIEGISKSTSEKYGTWKYTIKDDNGKIVIYLNEAFQIGDTVVFSKYKR